MTTKVYTYKHSNYKIINKIRQHDKNDYNTIINLLVYGIIMITVHIF